MFLFDRRVRAAMIVLNPPHRRGSHELFKRQNAQRTRKRCTAGIQRPSCYQVRTASCSLGGPEAHAANPTTQNPTTQPDAARPSQLHSALQCHRMAFEFGSLLICTQCSADTGLTCYGDCDDCIIMCGMRYALHHRVHHTLCIASLYA